MITNILLKKKINLTPYSLISNFKKKRKNNPFTQHAHLSFFILT